MDRTSEEFAEVQRVHDVLSKAMDREIWQIAELMVGKRDDQLFGETEFTLRDKVLRMGAMALEATVEDRKKRGTKAAGRLPGLRPRLAFCRLADAECRELDGTDGG
jgi:hypothetical protein